MARGLLHCSVEAAFTACEAGRAVALEERASLFGASLMMKLADQQSQRGYMCTNLDLSHEVEQPQCGVSMPQNQDYFCAGSNRPRFDAIARWIAQGALDN